jgi:cell division protein FtsW
MGVAVELLPVTGQPLPLISSGGTSIWMTCIAIGVILSVTKKDEEVALDLEEKRKRDEALQQLIDAQVAINEEDPSEENQQKLEELRYSIREEVKDLEGDSLIDGENPMNSVRNKE